MKNNEYKDFQVLATFPGLNRLVVIDTFYSVTLRTAKSRAKKLYPGIAEVLTYRHESGLRDEYIELN